MKRIPLTKGKFALVDDADYEYINQWKWYAAKVSKSHFYARKDNWINGKRHEISMHRLLNNTPEGFVTDHINHNTLDNRRKNLRSSTVQDNLRNMKKTERGIYFNSKCNRWRAQITVYFKTIYLGSYLTKEEALMARKEAEKKYWI